MGAKGDKSVRGNDLGHSQDKQSAPTLFTTYLHVVELRSNKKPS